MKRTAQQQLEESLRAAHALRPLPEVDEDWNRRVMNEIRRQSISAVDLPTLASPLVWRFAAASCCLALVLSFYALVGGEGSEQMALDLFMGDPLLSQPMRLLAFTSGIEL